MINLIHEISQRGFQVTFSPDFNGMLTITYQEEGGEYIRHEHVSYPGSTDKELQTAVNGSLINFLEEIKKGPPKKDGLAKKEPK